MEKTIGSRIRELRIRYNLGIGQLSKLSGLSYTAIYFIENEKVVRPHGATLNRIADTLGSTIDWILTEKGTMFPNGIKILEQEKAMSGDLGGG